LAPFRNWRDFAGPSLDTSVRVEGATVVSLSSAAPRRAIVNGRLDREQVEFARRTFEQAPEGDYRIVVVHHHFVPVPTGEGARPLPGARSLAEAFAAMGTDVVLGGHVHQLHLSRLESVPFLATGTTTSRRGRGVESGWNSLCVHRFRGERLQVTPYRRAPEAADFEPLESVEFRLTGRRRDRTVGEAAESTR
jgi:predicted phosphodiesterase